MGDMKDAIQHKVQSVAQHADVPLGYVVSGAVGSTPIWVDTLTGYLEMVAVLVAIGVGVSTWQLNRIKKKNLEKQLKKD